MADPVSDNSFFFTAAPTSTTTAAMAAVADVLLSRNGSFASRPTPAEHDDVDASYLPLPPHKSATKLASRPPSPAPNGDDVLGAHSRAEAAVFSPRDSHEEVTTAAAATATATARQPVLSVNGDKTATHEVVDGQTDTTPLTRTGDDATFFAAADGAGDDEGGEEGAEAGADGKPKATPLPIWQVLIVGSVLLTESLSGMMLMPFVGLFVAHLMNWTVERAGYLSGVLVGMFMLGQVLSGKLWGYISDRYGRKKPLVIGLAVGAAMMFVFGISPNIYIACAARFIHGFFNGTVLIAKTVVSDITDNSNRAKGFAWVSLAWAVGSLVGPTIGGFLYDPATNSKFASYNISTDSFLGQYPAFLPATILTGYIVFSFMLCVFFLEESNPCDRSPLELIPGAVRRWSVRRGCTCLALPQDRRDDGEDENEDDRHSCEGAADTPGSCGNAAQPGQEAAEEAHHVCALSSSTSSPMTTDHHDREMALNGASPDGAAVVPVTAHAGEDEEEAVMETFTYMDAIRYPPSRYLLILFMLYCALEIIYSEVMPLWAVAGRDVGGLGLFSDDVAILLLVCGAPALVANLVFPFLCDRLFAHNKMLFWQISITINAVCTAIVPVAAYIHGNRGGFWFTLGIGLARQFGLSWCFGLAQFLVPYVAKKGHVGTMFGINQAAGSATRCVIPFGAAPLFAWSISGRDRPFPINHFLLFMICVLCAIATFVISFLLKLPIEVAYREEKRARQQQQADDEKRDEAELDEPIVFDGQEMVDKEEVK